MPKYLILWEADATRVPEDAKERGAAWGMMMDMIKQDFKEGKHQDWGAYVGETRGYTISERSEVDIAKDLQRFYPMIKFEVHQIASVDQVAEVAKSLTE